MAGGHRRRARAVKEPALADEQATVSAQRRRNMSPTSLASSARRALVDSRWLGVCFDNAHGYAEQIVKTSKGDIRAAVAALADYDEATAAQAANASGVIAGRFREAGPRAPQSGLRRRRFGVLRDFTALVSWAAQRN